jgi:hypothetical protein
MPAAYWIRRTRRLRFVFRRDPAQRCRVALYGVPRSGLDSAHGVPLPEPVSLPARRAGRRRQLRRFGILRRSRSTVGDAGDRPTGVAPALEQADPATETIVWHARKSWLKVARVALIGETKLQQSQPETLDEVVAGSTVSRQRTAVEGEVIGDI